MDIAKSFDKMWYEETGNDIFNAGVTNDKFVLLANSNSRCKVAVKTPWGSKTERVVLEKIEMKGTVLAPLKFNWILLEKTALRPVKDFSSIKVVSACLP